MMDCSKIDVSERPLLLHRNRMNPVCLFVLLAMSQDLGLDMELESDGALALPLMLLLIAVLWILSPPAPYNH